jgi:hypothetical protein
MLPSHPQRRRSQVLPLAGRTQPCCPPALLCFLILGSLPRRRRIPGSSVVKLTYPSHCPAGLRRGRRAPVSRGLARLRLGLAVDLSAVGAAAHPRHQGLLLAIPVTGRLQGRRRARAASRRRRLRGIS